MNLKVSYFNISTPLIKENLRRFWAIPVLSFLTYFFSFTFPVLMSYSHLDDLWSYIRMSMVNHQPFFMIAHGIFPVLAAVVVFRYLHASASVSTMHSMPFSRAKLFQTNVLSGLLLVTLPFLLNGLILLMISKPVLFNSQALTMEQIDFFSRSSIGNWMVESLVIIFFVYSISVFAGLVSGNIPMHFAMAGMFNFILPVLYAVFLGYGQMFLFGFTPSQDFMELGLSLSPYLKVFVVNKFTPVSIIIYLLVSLCLLLLSYFLYTRRKLEKSGDSLVFAFMHPVISYLIAFLGMTGMGFFFTTLYYQGQFSRSFYMYAGFVAGSLIFFALAQMMVKKTPRIFNKKSFRDLSIYCVIAVLFVSCFQFDLTGYTKRIPSIDSVKSVLLTQTLFNNSIGFTNNNYSNYVTLKERENIAALTAFQRSILENRERFSDDSTPAPEEPNYRKNYFTFSYTLGKNQVMKRAYHTDQRFAKESPYLKLIFESSEFKNQFLFENGEYEKINSISLAPTAGTNRSAAISLSSKEFKEFLDNIDKDFKASTFEEMMSYVNPYCHAEIVFSYKDPDQNGKSTLGQLNLPIPRTYRNTIRWVEARQYEKTLLVTADDVDYIEISAANESLIEKTGNVNKILNKSMKITDKNQIEHILKTYETSTLNHNDYYAGTISLKGGLGDNPSMADDMKYREMAKETGYVEIQDVAYPQATEYNPNRLIYFNLNEGNVPGFVLEYFQ